MAQVIRSCTAITVYTNNTVVGRILYVSVMYYLMFSAVQFNKLKSIHTRNSVSSRSTNPDITVQYVLHFTTKQT